MALLIRSRMAQIKRPLCQMLEPNWSIPHASLFWEADRKGGYQSKIKRRPRDMANQVKEGMRMIGPELGKFKEEVMEKVYMDVNLNMLHGDYEVIWKFDDQTAVDNWVVTTDKDHNEGKSTAQFTFGRNKTGIFHGMVDTEVPKDGIVKSAGYCNIKSPHNWKSFKRQIPYDWELFTHLLMRVRGDGRPYQLILGIESYFDVQWNDQYLFPLFTRGGPYWQLAKIPFSKFFLSSHGRVQDKQESVIPMLNKIRYMGISLYDGWTGDFHLEIDYIGVIHDANHRENFAYEMYKVNPSVHT